MSPPPQADDEKAARRRRQNALASQKSGKKKQAQQAEKDEKVEAAREACERMMKSRDELQGRLNVLECEAAQTKSVLEEERQGRQQDCEQIWSLRQRVAQLEGERAGWTEMKTNGSREMEVSAAGQGLSTGAADKASSPESLANLDLSAPRAVSSEFRTHLASFLQALDPAYTSYSPLLLFSGISTPARLSALAFFTADDLASMAEDAVERMAPVEKGDKDAQERNERRAKAFCELLKAIKGKVQKLEEL
ncbi:hypothetical protein JCM10213_009068 [Rhodosporidiobolus nylandii]